MDHDDKVDTVDAVDGEHVIVQDHVVKHGQRQTAPRKKKT